jgi:hypothetical protein
MRVNSKRSGVEARHLGFYEPERGPNEHRPVEQRLEKLPLTWARSGRGMASVALSPPKLDLVAA